MVVTLTKTLENQPSGMEFGPDIDAQVFQVVATGGTPSANETYYFANGTKNDSMELFINNDLEGKGHTDILPFTWQ